MEHLAWFAFGGGVLAGLVVGFILSWFFIRKRSLINQPTITNHACLSGSQLLVEGTADAAPSGSALAALHVRVYDDPTQAVSPLPDGATSYPLSSTNFSVSQPLPSGLVPPTDLVVVWVEYRTFIPNKLEYNSCSGSGSGGHPFAFKKHSVTAAAEQLEAIPRAYRVSPSSPAAGGPAAELFGSQAEAPETLLCYVPEDSSPLDPFWRARGGPGPAREWTLRLLHRPGGFGAVLTVVLLVGAREVRLTWVTSDWRFHLENRLICESDEPCQSPLLVRPE